MHCNDRTLLSDIGSDLQKIYNIRWEFGIVQSEYLYFYHGKVVPSRDYE